MIIKIRNSIWTKGIALFLAFQIIIPFLLPYRAMAITGGPSSPDFTSFTQVGTSDMVDLFSGDFKYNIPLMDVGGYPINISYGSGLGMEDQASCVGLGWKLNAGGQIERNMRGIPDDFNGTDKIISTTHLKPNTTVGVNVKVGNIEVIGKELGEIINNIKTEVGFGLFMNNYTGLGFEFSTDASISIGDKNKPNLNLGLGLTANSEQGIGINPSVGLSKSSEKDVASETSNFTGSIGLTANYGSRQGLKSIAVDASANYSKETFATQENKETGNPERTSENPTASKTGSINGGSSIPCGVSSYVPQIGNSMLSTSLSVDIGTGLEAFWTNGKLKLGGYFNDQRIMYPVKAQAAYGYLYTEMGADDDKASLDFNRGNESSFTNNTPALPMTQMTYDIYTASGQGVNGMFRPYRGFGSVFDPRVNSYSAGASLGGDIGATAIFKGGLNVSANFNHSSSGRWTKGSNKTGGLLKFRGKSSPADEPVYFKSAGEFTAIDQDYYNKIQGLDPVRISITTDGDALTTYRKAQPSDFDLNLPTVSPGIRVPEVNTNVLHNNKAGRERRNQSFSTLTADQAEVVGLDRYMKSYSFTSSSGKSKVTSISRKADGRKGHHISEITVSKPDGTRYVYGEQSYNYYQKEVSFNPSGTGTSEGFVSYVHGVDNTTNNKNGIDHFFNSTEMPPYATSYQLTAVLSPDYVDSDDKEGCSPGDIGSSYTKFNYTRVYSSSSPYRWRNPYKEGYANFNEGYKSKTSDNKANYLYGEKEIKILQSIETKNYIAEFYYSDRKDAYDIMENGKQGTRTLKKLDRIELYARCDRELNGGDAIALKIVNFVYDYSLCKGLPSNKTGGSLSDNELANQGGKLTLKQIYFTYEKSKKGQLSPYIFHYADSNHDLIEEAALNPDYSFRGNNRWGNYKPNDPAFNNAENPYVEQDNETIKEDVYSAAWSMRTIQLPSGGLIKIELEADDYAYVQDKRAACMFKVLGFANSPSGPTQNVLYDINGDKQYLFVAAPSATSAATFKKLYIGEGKDEIKQLFFRFFIDLTGKGAWEYVSGYADIESTDFNAGVGIIKIKLTSLGDENVKIAGLKIPNPVKGDIHPIAKTAIQQVRINLPELQFGQKPEDADKPGIKLFHKLAGLINDVEDMIVGANRAMRIKGFGKTVDITKSYVRLQSPGYAKLGGGSRVAKISINDRWSTISGSAAGDFDYGQTYDYKKTADDVRGSIAVGTVISSGVATYEPFLGNDENALRQPVAYSEERRMAPDNSFYQEKPYGEMFYPSASVGYSKVKVTNLSNAGVSRTATGYIVHEYYTSKDFPVKVRNPVLERLPKKPSFLRGLFKVNIVDYMTASQSYVIELNNMNGLEKAQYVYAEGQTKPISSVQYFYKTQAFDRISNDITVIGKDGRVSTAQAGIEIDMVTDERESNSFTCSLYVPGNLDISPIPPPFPIPLPIPSVWPKVTTEVTRFRSIANTKVITRYAILEKTIATDLGSYVTTDNLAWDKETGEILLTRTQNDYKDPIYSFTYPAHWAYDGMGPVSKNIGIELSGVTINSGIATIPNAGSYFMPGDEVLVANGIKYWVTKIEGNNITLNTKTGALAADRTSTTLSIVGSGRTNQQTAPVGTITSLSNPIQGSSLVFKDVLNAGAIEFKEDWPGFCECANLLASTNPYVNGKKGNYRAKRSNLFLTGRGQSDLNRNTYTRKDGTYDTFDPFWNPNNGSDWKINSGQWTFTSEVTLYSPFGFEMENKDALGRYSSADYKYNNSLPTAVASNAQYKEIGADNFEDYDCNDCPDDHFSFKEFQNKITDAQSHSGRRSIKLSAGEMIQLNKELIACTSVATTPATCNLDGIVTSVESIYTVTLFGGTPPYSYLWELPGGSTSNSPSTTTNGNYIITVTDNKGCVFHTSHATAD